MEITGDDPGRPGPAFVRLLLGISGDPDPQPADVALAEQAGDWLSRHDWIQENPLGYVNELQGVAFRSWGSCIEVLRRVEWPRGLSHWSAGGLKYPVHSLAHALNTLAGLRLIPGERFSTFARDALLDHADVCLSTAAVMDNEACKQGVREARRPASGGDFAVANWVLREAARSAQRLSQYRVPA